MTAHTEGSGGEASPVPPLEPGTFHELRVHGVAGTSPASMLGLQAELTDRPRHRCDTAVRPGDITVWKPPAVEPDLRAWSWSSLTSGHWYQAFYLILLPFMIANLAGWMLLSDRRGGVLRVSALLVRLVGLLVTVVFVVAIQLVVADIVVWQWLYHRITHAHWVAGAGPAATALLLLGVVGLTRIRQRAEHRPDPWADHHDPVGNGFLHRHQDLLWDSPGINVLLRRLHLTGGLATIALLAAWPAVPLSDPWSTVRTVAFALAIGSGGLVVALLARVGLGDGTTGLGPVMWSVRRVVWLPPAIAVALTALTPLGLTPEAGSAPTLPALRGAAVWITLAVLVGVLALFAIGLVAGRSRRAINAPTLLLVAASVGAAFGAGLAQQVARLIDGDCTAGTTCLVIGQQGTWLAFGVTISLAVLVVVTAVRAVQVKRSRSWWEVAPRLTEHGTWITAVLGGVGALLGVTGIGICLLRPGGLPAPEQIPGWPAWPVIAAVLGPVTAVVVAIALRKARQVAELDGSGRRRSRRRIQALRAMRVSAVALVTVAAAVAVPVAVAHHWTIDVLGVALPPDSVSGFAVDVAVVLPTAAALTRIYGGITSRATRRGVGVLWDVGTFWPRWFHPFAPPTYSDRAVTRLAAQLDADVDTAGHTMLIAPHSQGAIIAATALLKGPERPRVAMLSYGSPWHRLYAEFFPAQVDAVTTRAVADRLGGGVDTRWINLYRITDPVGGEIPHGPQNRALDDPCHRMHSEYWLEKAYGTAAAELGVRLPEPAASLP